MSVSTAQITCRGVGKGVQISSYMGREAVENFEKSGLTDVY